MRTETIEIPASRYADFVDGYQFGPIIVKVMDLTRFLLFDYANKAVYAEEKHNTKFVLFRYNEEFTKRYSHFFDGQSATAAEPALSSPIAFDAGVVYPAQGAVLHTAAVGPIGTIMVNGETYYSASYVKELATRVCALQREICAALGKHYKFGWYKYKPDDMKNAPAPNFPEDAKG